MRYSGASVLPLLFALFAGCHGSTELLVGQLQNLSTQESNGTVTFIFYLNKTAEGQSPALRLSVSCVSATATHPLLVTVQQTRDVASWSIPYVENGYTYSFVERTLCPLLNIDPDHPDRVLMVTMEVSTSSPTPIDVQISSTYFEQFYHSLNNVATLTASPSAPAFLLFEHPPEHSRVRVRFSSMDSTSNVCAIASIQKTYCPVVELLDNPDHRGVFQTMRSQAAINVELLGIANETTIITDRQQTAFRFFYIVISVFSSNHRCSTTQVAGISELLTLERVDNFNPMLSEGQVLLKNVNITIDPAFPDWGYGVAAVVPVVIFSFLYIVALGWILITDYIGFYSRPMLILLEERIQRLKEFEMQKEENVTGVEELQVVPSDVERGITRAMSDEVRRLSDEEGKEISSLDIDGIRGVDETDAAATSHEEGGATQSSPAHLTLQLNDGDASQSGNRQALSFWRRIRLHGERNARNGGVFRHQRSLRSVLMGSQYDSVWKDVIRPTPHYPQYLHENTSSRPRRQKSVRTAYAVQPSHASSTDGGAATRSLGASIPAYHPSISLMSPVVDQVAMHNRKRVGLEPSISEEKGRVDISFVIPREEAHSHRRESYENAMGFTVGESTIQIQAASEEEESRCIKLCGKGECMCDLPEFDETSQIQKKYNLLSWYLVAAIIFYAIPAYQLVITYQQLLTVSGNQDVCFFNSLCSFSWRSSLITFTSFNNLYSNVGYFMLGILFIVITHRRQRMYRAVELVINNCFITSKSERVGVPQHFGIYYAIGLAMIAEGLMSTAYHICPGKINYQFDTTFMYVMASLGIFKLLESRSPDLKPGLHELLVLVACMILFVVVGVLYASSVVFYILFFIIHVTATFIVTLEIYYHWKIRFWKWESLKKLFEAIVSKPIWIPNKRPKWVFVLTSNAVNWLFALYAIASRPLDFGTFFLFVLLSNFILLFIYYTITKCAYKEWPSFRPIVFLVLALVFWACGIYFYSLGVTNWLMSPAESRDGNKACIALFFDSHDMWHFSSALALFFSFLMLTTIDDNAEATFRTKLRVF